MDSKKCRINLKPDKRLGFIIEARGECKSLLASINRNQGPYSKKVFNRKVVNICARARLKRGPNIRFELTEKGQKLREKALVREQSEDS